MAQDSERKRNQARRKPRDVHFEKETLLEPALPGGVPKNCAQRPNEISTTLDVGKILRKSRDRQRVSKLRKESRLPSPLGGN